MVGPVHPERRVPEVAPENGEHAQLVRPVEPPGHLLNLPVRLRGPEVDRGADAHRAHVERLLDVGEADLVVGVGVRQELVVVELQDEGNAVRVAACARPQRAQRRGDGVAAPLEGQFQQPLGIEVLRVGGERRARRMLDALIHRQDRDVPRAGKPPVTEQRLQARQDPRRPVRRSDAAIEEIRPRQVQAGRGDTGTSVIQQRRVLPEDGHDAVGSPSGITHGGCHGHPNILYQSGGTPMRPRAPAWNAGLETGVPSGSASLRSPAGGGCLGRFLSFGSVRR